MALASPVEKDPPYVRSLENTRITWAKQGGCVDVKGLNLITCTPSRLRSDMLGVGKLRADKVVGIAEQSPQALRSYLGSRELDPSLHAAEMSLDHSCMWAYNSKPSLAPHSLRPYIITFAQIGRSVLVFLATIKARAILTTATATSRHPNASELSNTATRQGMCFPGTGLDGCTAVRDR